jgi:invasion protein IalB
MEIPMRRLALLAALLLAACTSAPLPAPQNTAADETPEWVRRSQQADDAARAVAPDGEQARPARGLRLFLDRNAASAAAARRMGRANPWRITCRESVARDTVDCLARREISTARGPEGVQVGVSGRRGASGLVFVLTDHDWPTDRRRPTVRVDQRAPIELRNQVGFEPLLTEMLQGNVMHVSRLQWPWERRIEASIPLDGLREALDNLVTAAERAGFRM